MLIPDLTAFFRNRFNLNADREFGFGSMGGFYTFDEIVNNLDTLHYTYPDIVSEKIQIGNSFEGRPVYAVRISDNPDQDEGEPEICRESRCGF